MSTINFEQLAAMDVALLEKTVSHVAGSRYCFARSSTRRWGNMDSEDEYSEKGYYQLMPAFGDNGFFNWYTNLLPFRQFFVTPAKCAHEFLRYYEAWAFEKYGIQPHFSADYILDFYNDLDAAFILRNLCHTELNILNRGHCPICQTANGWKEPPVGAPHSFMLDTDTKLYSCEKCESQGNIVTLVMQLFKCEYYSAVKFIANEMRSKGDKQRPL